MRITITGASGLIGRRLTRALQERGDEVTPLSLRTETDLRPKLEGRDAVVHLAGEPVAQRWTADARRRILESREQGTRRLVEALEGTGVKALISASAVGYYGTTTNERLTEDAPPGDDFLAQVCVAWEREAQRAKAQRVVNVRTGVLLDKQGGALAKMLLPFRLGLGGPVAGGDQYMPWIHIDDVVGIYLAALDNDWSGPVNATAPEPVTNKEFGKALGRALKRPAVLPTPGLAIRLLYGEMAVIVTEGQRAVPDRTLSLGYRFQHPDLDEALRSALS
ncbi:MAG TPA: TIGR01777 family oxidoreductase [Solirubrobacter sp.]|nr:TIGR01777 family oxidoreductase [Solirubrobacter sp.]